MFRIRGSYLYDLGSKLHPLVEFSGTENVTAGQAYYPLFLAESAITEILQAKWFGLQNCLRTGAEFLEAVKRLRSDIGKMTDMRTILEPLVVWEIKEHARNFETILKSELDTSDLYYVIPKGGYVTVNLIMDGRTAFPDDLTEKVSTAIFDIQEATRCLAYERFTATAFHLHRANEAVLRKYWDVVTGGKARPKQESMGVYLAELKKKKKGSGKVRNILTEIKNMHRNPIIHPEHTLDQKQALALMGVIHASITYMLEAIPTPPQNALAAIGLTAAAPST